MSGPLFGIVPEEAFLDKRISLGALRVLRAIWSFCLRDGRIVWSDFLTSSQIARAAGIRPGNLAGVLRQLAHLEYIVIGPHPVNGIHSLRPHQRFGEVGPSVQEIAKSFRPASPEAGGAHSSAKSLPPHSQGGLTATAITTHTKLRRGSSSTASPDAQRKDIGRYPKEARPSFFPWSLTQRGILDLLAENGMEGAVPTQVALMKGVTFRRVALLVADGIARGQTTGMILTRLKGRDLPPKLCPLCGAKEGFHYGFTDGDCNINCPLSGNPDMTDEQLVVGWRHVRGKRVQRYWMGQEVAEDEK